MRPLLVVGAGLFGAQAAAYARLLGKPVRVFDAELPGRASPAAAGLFKQAWAGRKYQREFEQALPLLERLYGLRQVQLLQPDGTYDTLQFVPPSAILAVDTTCAQVSAIGDGWLMADGERHEGDVYVAAGVWCEALVPGLGVYGKAGSAFSFVGETQGRIEPIAYGRQAIAFVRDPGQTHFTDGTAERDWHYDFDRATLARAGHFGLTSPIARTWGVRPYAPGGPIFRRIAAHTWLATGGRKLGTLLGAAFARRLLEEELQAATPLGTAVQL